MKVKAYFIMIFTLLAALFGAAQEVIVVFEGAKTGHFIESHAGSEYRWEVFKGFSPDIEAGPDEYYFVNGSNFNEVSIRWTQFGLFYLKVTETDISGCANVKALAVSVLPNNRVFGFKYETGKTCFSLSDNSFELPLEIFDNRGSPLDSAYFPILVEFSVNNQNHSQVLNFNKQIIQIQEDWFNPVSDVNTIVSVELLSATDSDSALFHTDADKKNYDYTIFALPEIKFVTNPLFVYKGFTVEHVADLVVGEMSNAEYSWHVIPENGTSTDLESVRKDTAFILWDGPPGMYTLQVSAVDGNGCFSDTINQQIEIRNSADFVISAGHDTVVGYCNPYQLSAEVVKQPGITYSYLWQPTKNLNDATSENPLFTPGNSTTFVLTVTNSLGQSAIDSVKITIKELIANAGEDVSMLPNSTTILDGTGSTGIGLMYKWSTFSGKIESGENSASPIVSGFGMYYLEITDNYECVAIDSVNVYQLALGHTPEANDDYDTTRYLTEVKIPVLNNDTDQENSIVPSSLIVTQSPMNGTAYVDYDDFTIHYRPNTGFSGSDNFEYQICNKYNNCDKANVYVVVKDFNFLIPDAFSPNGDGINDYFEILGIEFYEGNSITIINRWGNKVYEAKNYGISTTPTFWDGKANTGVRIGNEELPTGTYYYILELGNGEKPIGGSIYLDR